MFIEKGCMGIKALIDGSQALIDSFQALVDGFQALVDGFQGLVDGFQACEYSFNILPLAPYHAEQNGRVFFCIANVSDSFSLKPL